MTRFCALRFILAWMAFFASIGVLADIIEERPTLSPEDLLGPLWFDSPASTQRDLALAEAVRLLEAKQYAQVIRKVSAYLETNPGSPIAHDLLGTALLFEGNSEDGLRSFQAALRRAPRERSIILKIGDVHLIRGEVEQARDQYQKAAQMMPVSALAHRRLGLALDNLGEFGPAMANYEQGLVDADRPYLQTRAQLGRLYNLAGRYAEALRLFEDYPAEVAEDGDVQFIVGNAHLGLNQLDQALDSFEVAATLDPDSPRAPLALGIVHRVKGEYDRSLEELRALARARPDLAEAHFQIGETLLQMGRFDDAIRSFDTAAASTVNAVFVRHRVADVHLARNQKAEAISIYQDLIGSDQAVLRTYDLLASAYDSGGRVDEAENTLRDAMTAYPGELLPYYRLGFLYGRQQQYDRAIGQFERALAIQPDHVPTLRALASAYRQKQDRGNAIEVARKILSIQTTANNKLFLAALYKDAGDDAAAIRLYEDVLAEEPEHPLALNNLAASLSAEGDYDRALEHARKAADVLPDNGVILDTLGWIQLNQGHTDAAIDTLSSAAALSADIPTVHYHLAMAHYTNEDYERALENFELALASEREFPERADAVAKREELLPAVER